MRAASARGSLHGLRRGSGGGCRTPERVFLVLAGGFGLFFAIATPPHDPPDEARHHARVWLISEGRLGVVGAAPGHAASVPRQIVSLHRPGHHYSDEQLSSGRFPPTTRRTTRHDPSELRAELRGSVARWDRTPVAYVTAYNPAVYAPYVPALWLARGLELSAAAGLYLSRLVGLACWLVGVVVALGLAPSQRWLLCAVALLPMSVFQAASISGDPVTQVAIFLWFAVLLRGVPLPLLLGTALWLGLVKPGYAPLALACFWRPDAPRSLGRRTLVALAALAAAALPTAAWALVVEAAAQPALVPGADGTAQLRHVLSHPFAFLAAVAGTVAALFPAWLAGVVGNLGHLDVEIPRAFTALGLAAVAASAWLERGALPARARLGWLAVCAVTALAIFAMAYLGWTPLGSDKIQGVQGRYFLPLLPFALVALPRIPLLPELLLQSAIVVALAVVLLVSALEMLSTYYA